ncbi:MAG: chromosome condensation regulator RCC1 [Planctomycetota bacterium]|nr:chromosome condensation regulator RCC1 [Planctomycetota bacterium]
MIRTAGVCVRAALVTALAACLGACSGGEGRGSTPPPYGTARAWGGNFNGQLGDGTFMDSFTPVQVVDSSDPMGLLTGATAVAAGRVHTVALLGDGTLRAWGDNFYGQLGGDTFMDSSTPVQVVDPSDSTGLLTGVTAVAGGWSHTVAVLGDGTLRAWGDNFYGQLGDGTITNSSTPVQVVDPSDTMGLLTGVTAIAPGFRHTVALLGDDTLRAWGNNFYGQLGDGMFTDSSTPVQVVDPSDPTGFLSGVIWVATGGVHTVAVLGDGTVRAWGAGGLLGDRTTVDSSSPVRVVDPGDPTGFLTGVIAVAAGAAHTVALLGDGTVRAWGSNGDGQLGDGTTVESSIPVQVVDPSDPTGLLTGVTAVATLGYHTVALLADSTLRAWGYNSGGLLGGGSNSDFSSTPVQVVDPSDPTGFLTGVAAVAPGEFHAVALR